MGGRFRQLLIGLYLFGVVKMRDSHSHDSPERRFAGFFLIVRSHGARFQDRGSETRGFANFLRFQGQALTEAGDLGKKPPPRLSPGRLVVKNGGNGLAVSETKYTKGLGCRNDYLIPEAWLT